MTHEQAVAALNAIETLTPIVKPLLTKHRAKLLRALSTGRQISKAAFPELFSPVDVGPSNGSASASMIRPAAAVTPAAAVAPAMSISCGIAIAALGWTAATFFLFVVSGGLDPNAIFTPQRKAQVVEAAGIEMTNLGDAGREAIKAASNAAAAGADIAIAGEKQIIAVAQVWMSIGPTILFAILSGMSFWDYVLLASNLIVAVGTVFATGGLAVALKVLNAGEWYSSTRAAIRSVEGCSRVLGLGSDHHCPLALEVPLCCLLVGWERRRRWMHPPPSPRAHTCHGHLQSTP